MNGSTPRFLGAVALVMILTAPAGTVAAPAGRYTYPAPGTVHDTKTRLTWQQLPTAVLLNFLEAKDYCSGLGATLGGTGWRLPTSKELQTIVDESRSTPAIDPTAFPGAPPNFFYTSVEQLVVDFLTGAAHFQSVNQGGASASVRCVRAGAGATSGAGGAGGMGGAGNGGAGGSGAGGAGTGGGTGGAGGMCTTACTSGTTQCLSGASLQMCGVASDGCPALTTLSCSTGFVCERTAPADCVDPTWAEWPMPNSQGDVAAGAPNPEAYTDNYLDGTVTDNVTGLMWQKVTNRATSQSGTWAQAVAFCPTLTLGGYSDWRLPSRIELVSLIDYARNPNPLIPTFGLPMMGNVWWSSSPVPGQASSAFAVNSVEIESVDMSLGSFFNCVR